MSTCCDTIDCCNTPRHSAATLSVALVGNPNGGKTTLFNALTGATQRVGNWPGVTVERKSGTYTFQSNMIEVIDLPGVYSLTLASAATAVDECITADFVVKRHADLLINIVDAGHLERHLYLTTQLLEMGVPVILALNMMDVAKAKGVSINVDSLSRQLGCPVVALEANRGAGIQQLKQAIANFNITCKTKVRLPYPEVVLSSVKRLAEQIGGQSEYQAFPADWLALRLLEGDVLTQQIADTLLLASVISERAKLEQALNEDVDIILADARYRFITQLLSICTEQPKQQKKTWTHYIDNIVLNRVLGIPVFLLAMYCLFVFAINVGGAFQDFFDISSQTLFVDGLAYQLSHLGAPAWLTALLANGVGKGINTTITFIPVIGALFLFLAFLEDSGYMARAAFVVDRFMRALGLPGKAFVPMIVGFGCNVPAVMAARTLENKRDRILTIMMSPFMSCGARLAIYAVFCSAFFPRGGQNIVFALYLIGILMAVLTGFILRKTFLKGEPALLVMELPPYHLPRLRTVCLHAWQRLKGFVFRAGKLIVPICVLIGALNALNLDGTINAGDGGQHSLLSILGQAMTPLFAPMGIHADNWPATVGLVTGVLAKEVVVGTLNTLYTQMGHLAQLTNAEQFDLWAGLQAAWHSIAVNLVALGGVFSNPVSAASPSDPVNQGVYGLMYEKFDGQVGAFAYLLFILLYFPCISTTAAMLREVHRGWSVFSVFWMTGIAYGVAVGFYQLATFSRHPFSSTAWLLGIVAAFVVTFLSIRWIAGGSARNELNRC